MDSDFLPLNEIDVGSKVVVKKLECTGSIRRRFLDLGLIKDTQVEILQRSPSGDPTAYYIRGAVIAIREDEAKSIKVELKS